MGRRLAQKPQITACGARHRASQPARRPTTMSNTRALAEIGGQLPLLDNGTLARLEQQVADERQRRKVESPLTTMRARLKAMEVVYSDIADSATGDWKSQATSDAIDRMDELDLARFAADVEAMVDGSDRWEMALDFSRTVHRIVTDVHEWGGQLVNGSEGEWCPDEVGELKSMWQRLIVGSRPPPPGIADQLAQLRLDFGDYDYQFNVSLPEEDEEEEEEEEEEAVIVIDDEDAKQGKRRKVTAAEVAPEAEAGGEGAGGVAAAAAAAAGTAAASEPSTSSTAWGGFSDVNLVGRRRLTLGNTS